MKKRYIFTFALMMIIVIAFPYLKKKLASHNQPMDFQHENVQDADLSKADASTAHTYDLEGFELLGEDSNTKYYGKIVNNDYGLYSMHDGTSELTQIALISPTINGDATTVNRVVDFGICGEWIIASAGYYEGSGNYFNGDFVRMKKDGSAFEHFWLTDSDTFVIAADWIYYNFWTFEDNPDNVYGCYRIHPDGSGKAYMGDEIYSVILYGEDGYLYGEYNTGETIFTNPITDLIKCKPDGKDRIVFFEGNSLPLLDEADYINYSNVNLSDGKVYFTVSVHGTRPGDSWRGRYLYEAEYSVNNDGSGLDLLSEHYHID